MTKTKINRETWLENAVTALDKKFFTGRGYTLPKKLQVSCGFPHGGSDTVGQCFAPECSTNGTTQMFICPSQEGGANVLDHLLHEMIHAAVGCSAGHRGLFRKLAKEFGFTGTMRSTFAEDGSELYKQLKRISRQLGKYPHAAMSKGKRRRADKPCYLRLFSVVDSIFSLVIRPTVIEKHGYPVDPWGSEMVPKRVLDGE